MKQLIYPKYVSSIFITSILFFFFSLTIGKTLNDFFPKLNEKDTKQQIYFQICLQIGLVACSTHIFREYVGHFMKQIIDTKGNPDKFAALVVAPIIFMQQTEMIKKIKHVSNN